MKNHNAQNGRLAELQKTITEIAEGRRAALNILEDSIRSREALRISEEKYRTLFNSIDDAFCIIEIIFDDADQPVDFLYLETNPAFVKHTTLPMKGKRVKEIIPEIEQFWLDKYGHVAKTGEHVHMEHIAKGLGGQWFQSSAFRIGGKDSNKVAVLFRNITERKRQEQHQQMLSEIKDELVKLHHISSGMQRLCKKLGKYFGITWCMFSELIKDGKTVTSGWNDKSVSSMAGTYQISDFLTEEQILAYNAGKLAVVEDVQTDERVNTGNCEAWGVRSFANVPVVRQGQWIFMLSFIDNKPRRWRPDEIDLIKEITSRIYTWLERAKSEAALQESEAHFRSLVTATSDIMYRVNADWSKMLYLKGMNFMADTVKPAADWLEKYIPERERAHVKAAIGKAIETKSIFDLEHRVIRLDKTEGWISSRAVPLLNERDEITEWFGMASDITSRKEVDRNTVRLASIVNSSEDAIISKDLQGVIQTWNKSAEKMFGYTAQEAIGKPITELIIPADRMGEEEFTLSRLARGESIEHFETIRKRKDGTLIEVSETTSPLRHGGRVIGASKIARDITERNLREENLRRLEERFNLAAAVAKIFSWEYEFKSRKISFSKNFEPITGSKLPLEFYELMKMIRPVDQRTIKEAFKKALQANDKFDFEIQMDFPKGNNGWYQISGLVVKDKNDIATRMVGIAQNITERKTIEEQKDEFLSIVSHELKTPVTSIKLYSEIVQEMLTQSNAFEAAELVQRLEKQIDRFITMINDLLDSTRIREGRLSFAFEAFDLDKLIEEWIRSYQLISPIHQILFRKGRTGIITADRERIGQVFTNLLSNAIKYSPDGGEIIVTSQKREDDVKVKVRDNGIGIAKEWHASIFERFIRRRHQGSFPGVGLGLYISANIVRRHGGEISVVSPPPPIANDKQGKGSEFSFTLPLIQNL